MNELGLLVSIVEDIPNQIGRREDFNPKSTDFHAAIVVGFKVASHIDLENIPLCMLFVESSALRVPGLRCV